MCYPRQVGDLAKRAQKDSLEISKYLLLSIRFSYDSKASSQGFVPANLGSPMPKKTVLDG